MYGYSDALEAAGAKVLEMTDTGDYQGTWIAFIEYKGEKTFVTGSYGSCSGCDAFQAEFGYVDDESDEKTKKRLAEFGKSYLDTALTFDQLILWYMKLSDGIQDLDSTFSSWMEQMAVKYRLGEKDDS